MSTISTIKSLPIITQGISVAKFFYKSHKDFFEEKIYKVKSDLVFSFFTGWYGGLVIASYLKRNDCRSKFMCEAVTCALIYESIILMRRVLKYSYKTEQRKYLYFLGRSDPKRTPKEQKKWFDEKV